MLLRMIVDGRHDVEAAETLGRLAHSHGNVEQVATQIVAAINDPDEPVRLTAAYLLDRL